MQCRKKQNDTTHPPSMPSTTTTTTTKSSSSRIFFLLIGCAFVLVFLQVRNSIDVIDAGDDSSSLSSSSSPSTLESLHVITTTTKTKTTTKLNLFVDNEKTVTSVAVATQHKKFNDTTTTPPQQQRDQEVVVVNKQQQRKKRKRLEFVHIPKTGGTSIENVANRNGISWGVCNFVGSKASIEKYNMPFQCNDSIISKESKWYKKFSTDGKVFPTRQQCRIGPVFWHLPSWLFDNIPNQHLYNPYYNATLFAVVRNPYTRLISEYFYRRSQILTPQQQRSTSREDEVQMMNQWLQESIKPLLDYTYTNIINKNNNGPSSSSSSLLINPFFIKDSKLCRFQGHLIPQHYFIYKPQQQQQQQQQQSRLVQVVDHVLKFENLQHEFDNLMRYYDDNDDDDYDDYDYDGRRYNFTLNDGGPSILNMSTFYVRKSMMGINNLTIETRQLIEEVYSMDFELFNYSKTTSSPFTTIQK